MVILIHKRSKNGRGKGGSHVANHKIYTDPIQQLDYPLPSSWPLNHLLPSQTVDNYGRSVLTGYWPSWKRVVVLQIV